MKLRRMRDMTAIGPRYTVTGVRGAVSFVINPAACTLGYHRVEPRYDDDETMVTKGCELLGEVTCYYDDRLVWRDNDSALVAIGAAGGLEDDDAIYGHLEELYRSEWPTSS